MSLLDLNIQFLQDYITPFLTQQDLVNLACTNFHFYEPCTRQLYKRLLVLRDPILRANRWEVEYEDGQTERGMGHRKCSDFTDCGWSAILGLQHEFISCKEISKVYLDDTQLEVVRTKLALLCESIRINPQLTTYIEEIVVLDNILDVDLLPLARAVQNSPSLKRFHIANRRLRQSLREQSLLVRGLIDCVDDLGSEDVRIALRIEIPRGYVWDSVKTLVLPSDVENYWAIAAQLQWKTTQIETFKLVLHPTNMQWNEDLIEKLNWETIRNLEIHVSMKLLSVLDLVPNEKLHRLSLVQNGSNETHAESELFDLKIVAFVEECVAHGNLRTLSIKHHLQPYGHFIDGVEGNYLRRLKIYNEILPHILQRSPCHITLYLPNIFHSLANFEPRMNVMLWNGCKCAHCSRYLGEVDEYLMYHKHFNQKLGKVRGDGEWRDLNSSTMFTAIGRFLSSRMIDDEMLMTGLFPMPLLNTVWNMHDIPGNVPFRCYDTHVVDQGEFDEAEAGKVEEVFFDTHEEHVPCSANRAIAQGLSRCVAHFLHTEMMTAMTNLYRGNAEELDIGHWEFKDGGDNTGGDSKLRKVVLNGISYSLGKELNGTNYFASVYD